MKFLFAFIFILTVSMSAFAQKDDDKKAALGVIDKLFEKMAAHQPEEIAALFVPDSQLFAVINQKDGRKVNRTFKSADFSQNFKEKRGEISEVMYKPTVEVMGDLAMVHGRYVFFTDDKISHCGVNAFNLVRTDDGWKIANASTTIEPEGCTAKEKKMKPSKTSR